MLLPGGPGAGNGVVGQRIIAVEKEDIFSPDVGDGGIDGGVLAAVFLADDGDGEQIGGEALRRLGGAVGGAIVNDDPLKVPVRLTAQGTVAVGQQGGPVVDRRDDGQKHKFLSFPASGPGKSPGARRRWW